MKSLPISSLRHSLLALCMAAATAAEAATQAQILDAALVTGDSSQLTDSHLVAQRLQQTVNQVSQVRNALLSDLYSGIDSTTYSPGKSSQMIVPATLDTTLPFVIGDKGNVLAALSIDAGGRAAAYGTNIVTSLATTNAAHVPLFKRTLQWLVTGSASGTMPASFKVSVVGATSSSTLTGLRGAGFTPTDAACNALTDALCASNSQLLVIGNETTASPTLAATVNARLKAGLPILYVNTSGWAQNAKAEQILNGLALGQGEYGGNYYQNDLVAAPGNRDKTITAAKSYGLGQELANRIVDKSWRQDYPWGSCSDSACAAIPDFKVFADQVEGVRKSINQYNAAGKNMFTATGASVARLWVLWADAVRQNIRYPMDKIKDPARFQEAYAADAFSGYVRDAGAAQNDLGSYAGSRQANMPVSAKEETLTITLPQASGFTAIGRTAVPGKRLSIKVDGTANASVAVFMNTQRTGSTRLWETNKYDRPRFLRSPDLGLKAGNPISVVSPYGGTLQLSYSGATPGQKVTVTVTGAASHPFLDMLPGEDNSLAINNYVTALSAANSDWTEIRTGGVEIHSRTDKMLGSVNASYGGDVQRLIKEINELFVGGAYSLAGFVAADRPLSAAVAQQCVAFGWDCTSEALHKLPSTQHINIDAYAACGSGCSGNPYDQSWNLNPRGWGESHELGHNLQVNRLKVYGGISAEVSNQIYPLQKNWQSRREFGVDLEPNRVNYRNAYNLIVAGRAQADPVKGVYDRLWANSAYAVQNGERMAFYTQWVHYWGDAKADLDKGWDIWTLMNLHQRQVDQADWASNKARLGYSTYAARPGSGSGNTSTDGNDNLLIGLSWITQRDQRPTFALWGITTSAAAQAQVQAYGFATQPAFFYANTTTNNLSTAKRLDMSQGSPAWPFP